MQKEKNSKKKSDTPDFKNLDHYITFSECISQICVTDTTPTSLLSEWEKAYAISNCNVIYKSK